MTKLKYYEASVDNDNFAVVEATSSGQAKYKYIQGDVVPFFAGYDNSDCDFTEVRVRRLKKLDKFEPDDSNYSDESLRNYLKYGAVEDMGD